MTKKFTIQYRDKNTQIVKASVNDYSMLMIETDDPLFKISDEYHSMHELYEHRMALNIALFHTLDHIYRISPIESKWMHPRVFKAKAHHPDANTPMFEGYFIVFVTIAELNGVWTSYHYHLKHWDKFHIPEVAHSPLFPLNHEDSRELFTNMLNFYERF